jgi:hypothetical protein
MRTRRTTLLVLALLTTGLVAGCSSSGSGGSSASSGSTAGSAGSAAGSADSAADSADAAGGVPAAGGEAFSAADPAGGGTASTSAADAPDVARAVTKQIRTARLAVQVRSLDDALTLVRSDATGFGGFVSAEDSSFGAPPSTPDSVITLRIPDDRLDEALDTVAKIGHELSRTTTVQDVTGRLADLTSREASERASLTRLRTLMAKATSLHDVVLLEGELTDRESDLESVQAQQRALSGRVALATLTVTLRNTVPPTVAASHPRTGFTGGLRHGWHALTETVRVVLVVLGALLPFALLLGALTALAWPLYLAGRRTWRQRRPAKVAPTP